MRIGVDVDGVLTYLLRYQLKYGKKYFKNCKKINENEIDIEGIFGCTHKEREKFWIKYIWKYCLSEPARENAAATLRKLKEEGHEIYIITGRAHTTEKGITGWLFRKMLIYWLKKEGIPYDKIIFCSEKNSDIDKRKYCIENKIDVMIDDKVENLLAVKDIVKAICFEDNNNRMLNDDNIEKVRNFNQVYTKIQEICGKKTFVKESIEEISDKTAMGKLKYFAKLKEYYKSLPYDKEKYAKQEKNYLKLCKVALPLFNKKFKPIVFNRELLPKESGVLYVANHNNYYDQFPLISAIGGKVTIHFLTATKMLNLKRGKLYKKTGSISVDRESKNDREAASDEVKKILLNGSNVFIFPEGRTNRGEDFLLEFHPGAIAIAQETGCKIVPMAVNDNYNKNNGPLCVRCGEPFTVSPLDDVIEKTEYLKKIIGELKQENIDYCEKVKKLKK